MSEKYILYNPCAGGAGSQKSRKGSAGVEP